MRRASDALTSRCGCLSCDETVYMDCVLTLCMVGVYSPLGVDSAILISAFWPVVSVGLDDS